MSGTIEGFTSATASRIYSEREIIMAIQVGIMYLDYLVHSVIKTVAWVHRGL